MKPAIPILILVVLMGGCSNLPPVRPDNNVFLRLVVRTKASPSSELLQSTNVNLPAPLD
jgi:hypothetical protein